ncbi:methylated-DNA--protein-cysteine methyltransferase [Saccharomyces pastorianus]|uniref:Methylated-DNA--protein-cysteine methyltransferase n=2 Tax=Saccharomyces TaxID=4930 RepID=A0A6C1E404_SACPS|nr:MGT1-like protein [Saccharomyces eubayanus]KOH00181.1 MGT1-like protein [Saccharomyces eubayanus]QID84022.1 methylated-DNA--protein-cysteine methyltransferase [Saccharomyces pastorianus]CAI1888636.1 hypothetical protein SEUBUCD650_0D00540 [Saccharomyces eubayanus]
MSEQLCYTYIETEVTGALLVFKERTQSLVFASLGKDESFLITNLKDFLKKNEKQDVKHELYELKDIGKYGELIENYKICLGNKMPLPPDAIPFEFLFGTKFQRKVWNELLKVEHGHVATYGDIAKKIGKPSAARSIGRACGANNLALVVPCHRIIGSNKKLTGYKWSLNLKEQLLNNERTCKVKLNEV